MTNRELIEKLMVLSLDDDVVVTHFGEYLDDFEIIDVRYGVLNGRVIDLDLRLL